MQTQPAKPRHKFNLNHISINTQGVCTGNTNTLLQHLCILRANPNPPRPTEVPRSLSRQILNHDTRQNRDLCFDVAQDAVVRQIKTICDLLTRPV